MGILCDPLCGNVKLSKKTHLKTFEKSPSVSLAIIPAMSAWKWVSDYNTSTCTWAKIPLPSGPKWLIPDFPSYLVAKYPTTAVTSTCVHVTRWQATPASPCNTVCSCYNTHRYNTNSVTTWFKFGPQIFSMEILLYYGLTAFYTACINLGHFEIENWDAS